MLVAVSCSKEETKVTTTKIGMVTDAGTIDDKSFNQGTWEGILEAEKELKIQPKYLKPAGTTEADYLKEIGNLNDAGYKFIVTPGFKFETTIFIAQTKYPDTKFVILDGSPHAGDYNNVVGPNTVAIFFAEHEAGFLAGFAAAVELQEGDFGFIGGMEIPPVQKFNWGFQQGVAYANKEYGTSITLKPENILYQGTFHDVAAGQQLAAQMFDRDVDAIFCAAGGVGVGAINEAKARASQGAKTWIIGVDVDQYTDGIYKDETSVILTSAVKKIDVATFKMIDADLSDEFPGGKTLLFDSLNNGVGIPILNPNLSIETEVKAKEIFGMLKAGLLAVSGEQGELIK
ncbi:MAG: BMP family ABC transporter substrate-binding protein [Spirochaetaceae bacterium]